MKTTICVILTVIFGCSSLLAQDSLAIRRLSTTLDCWQETESVYARNNTLFIATGETGFWTYDVSDPSNPRFVSTYRDAQNRIEPHYNNNYAGGTMASFRNDTFRVFDISDPSNIRQTGFLPYDHNFPLWDINEDYLCISHGGLGVYPSIKVFDISDPNSIHQSAFYNGFGLSKLTLDGNRAYGAGRYFAAFDISGEDSLSDLGRIRVPDRNISRIAAENNIAYLVKPDTIHIVDTSEEGNPVEVNFIALERSPSEMIIEDGMLYLLRSPLNHISVYDVRDPREPEQIASFETDPDLGHFAKSGNFIYAFTHNRPSLRIIDISNLNNPSLVYESVYNGQVYDVVVEDGFAYALLYPDGIGIVDISDPLEPELVSSLEVENIDQRQGIQCNQGYCYLQNGNRSIKIVDVSDSRNPQYIGLIPDEEIQQFKISYNRLFMQRGSNELIVYDISDPTEPFRIGGWRSEYELRDIEVDSNLVYIIERRGFICLKTLDFNDINNPLESPGLVGTNELLAVSENYLISFSDSLNLHLRLNRLHVPKIAKYAPIDIIREIKMVREDFLTIAYADSGIVTLQIMRNGDQYSLTEIGYYKTPYENMGMDVADSTILIADKYSLSLYSGPQILTVADQSDLIPSKMTLFQPYPNPFNDQVTLRFNLPSNQFTTIRIFDQQGRLIENLVDGKMSAGKHTIKWDARSVTAGIYFMKMECGEFSNVRKVVLVR